MTQVNLGEFKKAMLAAEASGAIDKIEVPVQKPAKKNNVTKSEQKAAKETPWAAVISARAEFKKWVRENLYTETLPYDLQMESNFDRGWMSNFDTIRFYGWVKAAPKLMLHWLEKTYSGNDRGVGSPASNQDAIIALVKSYRTPWQAARRVYSLIEAYHKKYDKYPPLAVAMRVSARHKRTGRAVKVLRAMFLKGEFGFRIKADVPTYRMARELVRVDEGPIDVVSKGRVLAQTIFKGHLHRQVFVDGTLYAEMQLRMHSPAKPEPDLNLIAEAYDFGIDPFVVLSGQFNQKGDLFNVVEAARKGYEYFYYGSWLGILPTLGKIDYKIVKKGYKTASGEWRPLEEAESDENILEIKESLSTTTKEAVELLGVFGSKALKRVKFVYEPDRKSKGQKVFVVSKTLYQEKHGITLYKMKGVVSGCRRFDSQIWLFEYGSKEFFFGTWYGDMNFPWGQAKSYFKVA